MSVGYAPLVEAVHGLTFLDNKVVRDRQYLSRKGTKTLAQIGCYTGVRAYNETGHTGLLVTHSSVSFFSKRMICEILIARYVANISIFFG